MTSRADALRDLIAAVEAGSLSDLTIATFDGAGMGTEFWSAFNHSLDAVARLEAPLIERGYRLRVHQSTDGEVYAVRLEPSRYDPDAPEGEASMALSEARARLLAVLRALLSEQPRDPA